MARAGDGTTGGAGRCARRTVRAPLEFPASGLQCGGVPVEVSLGQPDALLRAHARAAAE